MALAQLIFLLCYIAIITDQLNRAFVACIGGLLMVLFGVVEFHDMFIKHIDWATIVLLFSMMVIVSITSRTGVFEYIAVLLAQKVRGRPLPLLVAVSALTAFGSAFLDNVTTVLLLVPIVLTLTEMLGVTSIPYLTVIILFSNIGGTATLIGDPPNIMIGQEIDHLTFNDFLIHMTPVVVIIYFIVLFGLTLYFRRSLHVSKHHQQKLLQLNAETYIIRDSVLFKSLFVLFLTTAGFLFQPLIHIELTTIAMSGALLLVLLTHGQLSVGRIFGSVEWMTLFFFAGLFMLVGGLKEAGVIDEIAKAFLYYTEGDLATTGLFILWTSGLFSGFVDNIPFVAAMIPVIIDFQNYGLTNDDSLWWSLALGSCLGGNGTLIGASANVIVAGIAAKKNHVLGFIQFFKIGFPVVLLSLAVATVYLYVRYFL